MSHSGTVEDQKAGTVEDHKVRENVDSRGPAPEALAWNLVRGCSCSILSMTLTAFSLCVVNFSAAEIK